MEKRENFFNRIGTFFFRHRRYLPIPLMILCLILARPRFPLGSEIFDEWIDGVGIFILLIGEAIRFWVAGYSQKGTSIRGRSFQASKLVTTGPYAYVRHPLYLANFLIGLGVCVIIGVAWVFIVYLAYFLIQYISIVVAEENSLSTQFKEEYEAYASQVPRFIPKLRRANPRGGVRQEGLFFNWKRALKREHDTICGFTMAFIFIEILDALRISGIVAERREILSMLTFASFFLLVWRFTKDWVKNRKIRLLRNYWWIFTLLGASTFSFIRWGI